MVVILEETGIFCITLQCFSSAKHGMGYLVLDLNLAPSFYKPSKSRLHNNILIFIVTFGETFYLIKLDTVGIKSPDAQTKISLNIEE